MTSLSKKITIFSTILMLFFSISSVFSKSNSTTYLSIGAMFRNEAKWLKEWIEFHRLVVAEGYKAIYPNGKVVDATEWVLTSDTNDRIRINHYWSRDRKYFDEVKSKGVTDHAKTSGFRELFITDTYNHTDDTEIFRFVPKLRKRLGVN